jgi:hypothetical protein
MSQLHRSQGKTDLTSHSPSFRHLHPTNMRLVLLLSLLTLSALAFTPVQVKVSRATSLNAVNRRDVLFTVLSGVVAVPAVSHASGSTFFFDEKIETVHEASQMPTGNRLDLNSAFVVRTGRECGEYDTLEGVCYSTISFNLLSSLVGISRTTSLSLACTRMRRANLPAMDLT